MGRLHRASRRDERTNALWGRGGRGLLAATVALIALALPFSAAAGGGPPGKAPATHVGSALLKRAQEHPKEKVRVIIQAKGGVNAAKKAFEHVEKAAPAGEAKGSLKRQLKIVGAVAAELPAARVAKLAEIPGLVVTVDAPVRLTGTYKKHFKSKYLWPKKSGNSALWDDDYEWYEASMPAIAIVDSGIEADRQDFAFSDLESGYIGGSRIVADVKLGGNDDPGDSRGHGTFVAGIAAGSSADYTGAAPLARIFSIDVMDSSGRAYTSDVIYACDVILENKDGYNIRVANFSLHSAAGGSIRWDPLAKAVEKLWFNGVVVVASAGNYGSPDGPTGVPYAPGSDPFVITVGAVDPKYGWYNGDDSTAPWSAYGYSPDGFAKPEVSAPGRYMVGPVPVDSTLAQERPEQIEEPGYIQLSGTSFATPVVSGTVAQMLARNPWMTPDQVKGALMVSARPVPQAAFGAAGVGQVSAARAAAATSPPNPNEGLNHFITTDEWGQPVFDTESWGAAAWGSESWDDAAWGSAAWGSASFDAAAWGSAAWSSAAWGSDSWEDSSFADAAWGSESYSVGAEGDYDPNGGYVATETDDAAFAEEFGLTIWESTVTEEGGGTGSTEPAPAPAPEPTPETTTSETTTSDTSTSDTSTSTTTTSNTSTSDTSTSTTTTSNASTSDTSTSTTTTSEPAPKKKKR